MAAGGAEDAWIRQVLGFEVPRAGESGGVEDGPMLPIWLDAKEAVDRRIGSLQLVLRRYGDESLDRIADAGLNGLTDKASVGLMVALREADAPGAGAKQRTTLAQAIGRYRRFLGGDETVELLDSNPFGVAVDIRGTLDAALNRIEQQIN